MTLQDYAKLYDGLVCRWDHAPLTGKISHYNHSGGQEVENYEMPQWISMACTKCGYEWSYRKLHRLQFHTDRYKAEQAERNARDAYGATEKEDHDGSENLSKS